MTCGGAGTKVSPVVSGGGRVLMGGAVGPGSCGGRWSLRLPAHRPRLWNSSARRAYNAGPGRAGRDRRSLFQARRPDGAAAKPAGWCSADPAAHESSKNALPQLYYVCPDPERGGGGRQRGEGGYLKPLKKWSKTGEKSKEKGR